jgi:hypothetical protein
VIFFEVGLILLSFMVYSQSRNSSG